MSGIRKYSKEWFVNNGLQVQKDAAKKLKSGTENFESRIGFFSNETFLGTREEVKNKAKQIEEKAGGKYYSEADRIAAYGGVDNLFDLIDGDGDGIITEQEVADIAAVDTDEMAKDDNTKFSAKDLLKIYENVMTSENATVEQIGNKSVYSYQDGSTTELLSDNDGQIIEKTLYKEGENGLNITKFSYEDSTKLEQNFDKNGRVVYEKVQSAHKEKNKTVTVEYSDDGSSLKTIDTVGRVITEKTSSNGNIEVKQTLKYNSDGKIDDTAQNNIGDCWVLASVNALRESKTGSKIIKDAICQNSDGSVTVKLKGVNKEYTYSPEQIAAQDYPNEGKYYARGDIDMVLIEMAIKDYRLELLSDMDLSGDKQKELMTKMKSNPMYAGMTKSTLDNPLDGGNPDTVFKMLTGKDVQGCIIKPMIEEQLGLKQKHSKNYAMVVDFKQPDGDDIIIDHAYTISKVTKDMIYIINPHDSSKQIAYPKDKFLENCLSLSSFNLK
jgi:hypothetical protein